MRQTKMIEWMENVEKAISRIMADKVTLKFNFFFFCADATAK
jgi:hypothetical protein